MHAENDSLHHCLGWRLSRKYKSANLSVLSMLRVFALVSCKYFMALAMAILLAGDNSLIPEIHSIKHTVWSTQLKTLFEAYSLKHKVRKHPV